MSSVSGSSTRSFTVILVRAHAALLAALFLYRAIAGPLVSPTAADYATLSYTDSARTVSYRVDSARSSVAFTMRATLHTVVGKTRAVSGVFAHPSAPGRNGFPVTGMIVIAARTLDTGNSSRDKRMRSESLAVDRFPEIVFDPSRAAGNVTSLAPGTTHRFTLAGDLTLRGVTRPVSLDATATITETGIAVNGSTTISFLDYGVPDPSNMILRVSSEVKVSFDLEGDRF